MCFQLHDSEPENLAGDGTLKMSSLYEERLLFCSLCFPTEWERTSTTEKVEGFLQSRIGRRKGGLA